MATNVVQEASKLLAESREQLIPTTPRQGSRKLTNSGERAVARE
jgi:hypothetical protein